MKRTGMLLLATVIATAFFLGCASADYMQSARATFNDAKAVGAEQKAPFEYYSAEVYLDFAMHEAAEGDKKQAVIFADKAETFSNEAFEKAGGAK